MSEELETTQFLAEGPELSEAEAQAAARAVVILFSRWGLGGDQARRVLGSLPAATWKRWQDGEIGPVDRELGTRLSLLLGIHVETRRIFGSDAERAYAWIRAENAAFGGRSARDVMLEGGVDDLLGLRVYLGTVADGPFGGPDPA
jgi:hypothetical protein